MANLGRLKSTQRLTDDVYNTLRDAILDHRLEAGAQLSVPELARQLGVSRSPVRDAVLQLVADGLAVGQPRKGATVAKLDKVELISVHEIREVLEGLSARLAASSIDDAQLSELRQILKTQAQYVANADSEGYLKTDYTFHSLIATAGGNQRLAQFLRVIRDQMRISSRISTFQPGHLKRGLLDHEEILAAIAACDPAGAELRMRDHVSASRQRLETIFSD